MPRIPLRAFCGLTLAATGCRQVAELSPETPPQTAETTKVSPSKPPAWLASESAAFEQVQAVLAAAGCPEVGTAVMRVSEEASLPSYSAKLRTLTVPPFRDGPEKLPARIAQMSARRFFGGLSYIEAFGSTEAAYEAYGAFLTVAIAHEMWHHIRAVRRGEKPPSAAEIYDLEAEAVEVEQAFLAHVIGAGKAPKEWASHYRRSVLAIRDSIPKAALDAVPNDPKALREEFARAYATYGMGEPDARDGVNVQISAAVTVYAAYTAHRMKVLERGPRALGAWCSGKE